MKILFIDHFFHKRTSSSKFFQDLLAHLGDVTVRYDDSFSPQPDELADLSDLDSFDLVVVWQMTLVALTCAKKGVKNILFVPMADSSFGELDIDSLKDHKVLCFSSEQYIDLQQRGFTNLLYARYAPMPKKQIQDFGTLRPYLWQRRNAPDWKFAVNFLKENPFERFVLNQTPDYPGTVVYPNQLELYDNRIAILPWVESKDEAEALIAQNNLYFAPRYAEGIGMAFLDAMAMGIPVVAPNTPTHNEYICNGVNGFLYEPGAKAIMPPGLLEKLPELSRQAQYTIEAIRGQWILDRIKILSWLKELDLNVYPKPGANRVVASFKVVVVVKDDPIGLMTTLCSLSTQLGIEFQTLVVDGSPGEACQKIIKDMAEHLPYLFTTWAPDKGIYDAMNKGAQRATEDYVIYINAGDTLFRQDSLFEMQKALEFNKFPDLLAGSFCFNTSDSYECIKYFSQDPLRTFAEVKRGTRGHRFDSGVPNHNSMLIRRSLLLDTPYDLDYKVSADTHHYYNCLAKGKSIAIAPVVCTKFLSGGFSFKNRIQVMKDMKRTFLAISEKPKATSVGIKLSLPLEIAHQKPFGFKWRDIKWMLLNYPYTTLHTFLFDRISLDRYRKNSLLIHFGQGKEMARILDFFKFPVTCMCSEPVYERFKGKYKQHTLEKDLTSEMVKGKKILVIAANGIPKEGVEFLKQFKIRKFGFYEGRLVKTIKI